MYYIHNVNKLYKIVYIQNKLRLIISMYLFCTCSEFALGSGKITWNLYTFRRPNEPWIWKYVCVQRSPDGVV